jgi:chaperonin GroEL (HSP60 family)
MLEMFNNVCIMNSLIDQWMDVLINGSLDVWINVCAMQDLSLDYLAKAKILVVREVERDDIEFISRVSKWIDS